MSTGNEQMLHARAVRAQLNRILASREFSASGRSRALLRFVVEETLAGRGERIKAFAIAVEVFGRSEDFDAQGDPLVRLEAGRLRRALAQYYLTGGRDDPIEIAIAKGGYRPDFLPRAADGAGSPARAVEEAAPRRWRWPIAAAAACLLLAVGGWLVVRPTAPPPTRVFRPSVLVAAFEPRGEEGLADELAQGVRDQIVTELLRFREITVYGRGAASMPAGMAPAEQARQLGASHLLGGNVVVTGGKVRIPGQRFVQPRL